ncbi:MAG: protein-glutamate O-methyltransferase CheR [Firmicutes bacterium]|nr:protein-glutamate O-methyltransferase CheR [Bacillota bacterium]
MSEDKSVADEFALFAARLAEIKSVDLHQYKRTQMERRLTSLRDKRGFSSWLRYLEAAVATPELMDELLDRMTINVSAFFRNPLRWDTLRYLVLPQLQAQAPLRVWSAACSTGQEPYSLAILLAESGALRQSTLLATDVDERALQIAQKGAYLHTEVAMLPAQMQKTYFVPDGDHSQVVLALREHVQFLRHDLCQEPFFTTFDLILCRNMMIYLTDFAKERLYRKFCQSLRVGGILFVGSTEQIIRPEKYGFVQIYPFFYQRVE